MAPVDRPCKDCPPGTKRKAPHPGPRCATHHRDVRKARRVAAQEKRVEKVYGLTADEYDELLDYQSGACAICQRAYGIRRRLAVDHDHPQAKLDGHPEEQGCPNCVRGLLCKSCNTMLGRMRDDADAFQRAANYLRDWPFRALAAKEPGSTAEAA